MDKLLLTMGAKLGGAEAEDISMEDYNDVKKEHLGPIVNAVRQLSGVSV
ncbi:hypothetical protein [Chitinophaga sp.]|nr:hypothetical protein [Chitinophaga sp.]HWV69966.1 hypothetical protein [Chitinophaga sp.]